MEEFLTFCCLQNCLPKFREYEIEFSDLFSFLKPETDDILQELIPDSHSRSVFLKELKIRELAVQGDSTTDNRIISYILGNDPSKVDDATTFLKTNLNNAVEQESSKRHLAQSSSKGVKKFITASSRPVYKKDDRHPNETDDSDSDNSSQKSHLKFPTVIFNTGDDSLNNLPPSKRKQLKDYILGILNPSREGEAIVKCHEIKHRFENKQRKKLTDLIVSHFINNVSPVIKPNDFKTLALGVQATFKGENAATYYIASCKTAEGKKIQPGGKLYQSYQYKKDLIRKSVKSTLKEVEAAAAPPAQIKKKKVIVEELSDELQRAWKFVHNGKEPAHLLLKDWKLTFHLRQIEFSGLQIFEYMKLYPGLDNGIGKDLINADFDELHKGKGAFFFQKWPELREHIIQEVDRRIKNESSFKKFILEQIPNYLLIHELSEEERDFYGLILLVFLFPATVKIGNTRYSREVVKEDFLLYIKLHSEKRAELKRRNDRYANEEVTIQPVPILVGTNLGKLSCSVEIDNIHYSCASVIESIDLCFKIYTVFNAKYPKISSRVWLLIQRFIYEIEDSKDILTSDVATLGVDLKLSR